MSVEVLVGVALMAKRKKEIDVAVVIADASPILTLARIDRLDLGHLQQ